MLEMGQDRLSKEEAGDFLEQWSHVINTTQEIKHITRNFLRVAGDYLGAKGNLSQAIHTWT